MDIEDSPSALRAVIRTSAARPESATFEAMLTFYRDERAEGCVIEDDGVGFRSGLERILKPVEREIGGRERRIGAAQLHAGRILRRRQRVRYPIVGPGMEMAARARCLSVTAGLHVPVKRLAQRDCHLRIGDELAKVRRHRRVGGA